jgi:cell division protein FtsL
MAHRHDITNFLKILACVVLIGGLVMQICMLAAVSSRTKATAQVNANIKQLSAEKDNYNVKLAGFYQRANIEERAMELGMQWPDNDQLRVISIPSEYKDTSTHTAEIADVQ